MTQADERLQTHQNVPRTEHLHGLHLRGGAAVLSLQHSVEGPSRARGNQEIRVAHFFTPSLYPAVWNRTHDTAKMHLRILKLLFTASRGKSE